MRPNKKLPPTTKELKVFREALRCGDVDLASKHTGVAATTIKAVVKSVSYYLLRYNKQSVVNTNKITQYLSSIFAHDVLLLKLADSYEKHLSSKKPLRTLDKLTVEELLAEIRDVAEEVTTNYFADKDFMISLETVVTKAVRNGILEVLPPNTKLNYKKIDKHRYERKRKSVANKTSPQIPDDSWLDNPATSGDGVSETDKETGKPDK